MQTEEIKEGTVLQKAFEIDLTKIEEGFLASTISCYAEGANEARWTLFHKVRYDGWKLKYSGGAELTYLNIPVKRIKALDKVVFEGREVVRENIAKMISKRERDANLQAILDDASIEYCYILKGNYYRPNHCGYTSKQTEAGVYPKSEAVQTARSCEQLEIVPVNIIKHNDEINRLIEDLKTRIIK